MPTPLRRLLTPANVVALLLAVVAATFTFWQTTHGVGISYDSINYLSTAQNIADGRGVMNLSLTPFTIAPPGAPALFSIGGLLGSSVEVAARVGAVICYFITVLLANVWFRRHTRSQLLASLLTASVAGSISLMFAMRMAWSEPYFIVVTLAFLMQLETARAATNRTRLVAVLIALTSAAFMFRYAGVVLWPVGVGALAWVFRRDKCTALRVVVPFAVGSVVLPVALVLRNLAADNTPLGPRGNSIETKAGLIEGFSKTLKSWALGLTPPWPWAIGIGIAGALVACAYWYPSERSSALKNAGLDESQRATTSVVPVGLFVIVYGLYMIYSELSANIDPIGDRLLSPALVPVAVLLLAAWNFVDVRIGQFWIRGAFAGVLSLVAFSQVHAMVIDTRYSHAHGINLLRVDLVNPQTLAVASMDPNTLIYSNRANEIWALTRHQPAREVPKHHYHRSTTVPDEVPAFVESLGCRPTVLVWFGPVGPGEFFSPTELAQVARVTKRTEFNTGITYEVSPLDASKRCGDKNLTL